MTSVHILHMAAEAFGSVKLICQLGLLYQIFHCAEFCTLDNWISLQETCQVRLPCLVSLAHVASVSWVSIYVVFLPLSFWNDLSA